MDGRRQLYGYAEVMALGVVEAGLGIVWDGKGRAGSIQQPIILTTIQPGMWTSIDESYPPASDLLLIIEQVRVSTKRL
jgi:hypothetical protein